MISIQYASTLVNPEYNHAIEFGVAEGRTIKMMRESLNENYKVFGFDSFFGLPEDWVGTHQVKGDFSTNGVVPEIENVKFFKGWFEDTIPEYLKEASTIGLLHVDCDLYSSTKTVLDFLTPIIKKNTIVIFDDWNCYGASDEKGERLAFKEFVLKNPNFRFNAFVSTGEAMSFVCVDSPNVSKAH